MPRRGVGWCWVVLLAADAATVVGAPALAREPCRAACAAARLRCRAAAAAALSAARDGCPRTAAPRRACLGPARAVRRKALRSCRDETRACRAACGRSAAACGTRGHWLEALNFYRGVAGLPAVDERADLSAADAKHAAYMVARDELTHAEDPAEPRYTADGASAGTTSEIAGSADPAAGGAWAIELFIAGPFHAVALLDPRLVGAGFGIAHDGAGSLETAAVLDALSARGAVPPGVAFPVRFPAPGAVLPLTRLAAGETPDPLTSCPGYAPPAGVPLLVELGTGTTRPAVTAHRLERNGIALEHCVFDQATYMNPDPTRQALGRAVLAARNAVVVLPRRPLARGRYRASITTGGERIAWAFRVSCPRAAP